MPKFRKKPVVIEAFKLEYGCVFPDWFRKAMELGDVIVRQTYTDICCDIKTLEGTMIAISGDYIIQGVNGEIYPCKVDIFEKTYDPADLVGSTPKSFYTGGCV